MLITKTSMFTGNTNTLDLPITQEQIDDWMNGSNIQDVMPQLNADQREFMISGAIGNEFNNTFPEPEE